MRDLPEKFAKFNSEADPNFDTEICSEWSNRHRRMSNMLVKKNATLVYKNETLCMKIVEAEWER